MFDFLIEKKKKKKKKKQTKRDEYASMDEGLLANDMLLLAINGFITRYVYAIGYSMVRTKFTFKLKFADLVLAVIEPLSMLDG